MFDNMAIRSIFGYRIHNLKKYTVVLALGVLIVVIMIGIQLHRMRNVVTTLNILSHDGMRSKLRGIKNPGNSSTMQKCVIPVLDPFDPEIMPYLRPPFMEKCRLKQYGVVKKGVLRLKVRNVIYASVEYIERDGDFKIKLTGAIQLIKTKIRNYHKKCSSNCGWLGVRCPDFCGEDGVCCRKGFPNCPRGIPDIFGYYKCMFARPPPPQDLDLVYPLKKEFFKLHLIFNNGEEHEEYHFAFVKKPEVKKRNKNVNASGINIIMLLFDSVSHAHAARSIQKSYKYLTEHPRTVIMQGHSIVGAGTTPQMCAMLTGVPEKELPEARKGFPNAKPVDNWPWIFKDMHEMNYKTLFSEDDPGSAMFNYRLMGFVNSPTTHYLRPWWLAQMPKYTGPIYSRGISCPHQFNFDYLAKYFDAYTDDNKFALLFNNILHNKPDKLENTDEDILHFYQTLSRSAYANNTVVFLMGDHGLRTSSFRYILQGKLEERLPFMSITVPPMFDSYPQAMKNLVHNSQLMTSHFDTYVTMQHLLTFPQMNDKVSNKYGRSLFTNIEKLNRTCADAGVDQHWCTCLNYKNVDPIKDKYVSRITKKVIQYINDLNQNLTNKCAMLTLRKIIRAGRTTHSKKVNQFVDTKTKKHGCDSCYVKYDKSMQLSRFRYQINFSVSPSGGEYEADGDVSYDSSGSVNIIVDSQISRTNLYGDQPSCIKEKYPHLRPYCFCSNY